MTAPRSNAKSKRTAFKRTRTPRVRLGSEFYDFEEIDAFREREAFKEFEAYAEAVGRECEHLHGLVRQRNIQIAVLLVCLLKGVAPARLTPKEGHTVVEQAPKCLTTSYQSLYAGLLLKAITQDDPTIDLDGYLDGLELPDGTPLFESES